MPLLPAFIPAKGFFQHGEEGPGRAAAGGTLGVTRPDMRERTSCARQCVGACARSRPIHRWGERRESAWKARVPVFQAPAVPRSAKAECSRDGRTARDWNGPREASGCAFWLSESSVSRSGRSWLERLGLQGFGMASRFSNLLPFAPFLNRRQQGLCHFVGSEGKEVNTLKFRKIMKNV